MGDHIMVIRTLAVGACILAVVYAAGTCSTKAADIPSIAVRQELCPPSASFFGFKGCACALVFACLGAAYGTAKSGVGVANMGVLHAHGDEVYHSNHYGWCARYLRAHRCCPA